MERAEKAKSPEMETAGLPPNDMKRFYVNGRHLLREIAIWIIYGLIAFFTGREPQRDKHTR